MQSWHNPPVDQLFQQLSSSPRGLSTKQAEDRFKRYGANQLDPPPQPSFLHRIGHQIRDPMVLVLLAAAGLSLLASRGREWLDAGIIVVIVLVNAILSISQEDRAQQALEELHKLSSPQAKVLRNQCPVKLPASQLVPGDLILLEAGDLVPADGRILTASRLQTDESSMTGESLPVEKGVHAGLPPQTPLAEWSNMVIAGTLVTAGHGTALVCATGMDTQMGQIAGLLMDQDTSPTPLQEKMEEISRTLSLICLVVCGAMFGVGLLQGKHILEMFFTAVSLAVAAIPEGLPAIVTIVLALGVRRMAHRGAIIKKLPAVETLGCAGVICSDKTGTLTQNKMTVQQLWIPKGGRQHEALLAAALCNDGQLVWRAGAPTAQGDPTECALLIAAARSGMDQVKLEAQWPRQGDLPFDSQRKLMSTLHSCPQGGFCLFVKGAPDILLPRCTATLGGPLSPEQTHRILQTNDEMAQKALRVLGVAMRPLSAPPSVWDSAAVECDLIFLGLFGMMDPPRDEVKEAVALCHRAGVRPVMITGDHKQTAIAVSQALDIHRPGDWVLTGAELDFMPQELLEENIQHCSVFARVTPEHKLRIVKAWQDKGQVVAMTGDGVNDAPALKASDIGCAMGQTGTDVAKGASHMILTDDNFSTIVQAIQEGRGIYSNIRKAIHYLLSCNIGEIVTIFVATLLNVGQMPLLPVQLLWLNLVTDSLPALALGMEGVEEGIMEQPPRPPQQGLFDRRFSLQLLWQGAMVGTLALTAYFLGLTRLAPVGMEGPVANTMAFATLTLCQLFHAWNIRSEHHSIFALGLTSNPTMTRAFLLGLTLQLLVLCVPPIQSIFSVVPMNAVQWITVFALAMAPIPICEYWKSRSTPPAPPSTSQTKPTLFQVKH